MKMAAKKRALRGRGGVFFASDNQPVSRQIKADRSVSGRDIGDELVLRKFMKIYSWLGPGSIVKATAA